MTSATMLMTSTSTRSGSTAFVATSRCLARTPRYWSAHERAERGRIRQFHLECEKAVWTHLSVSTVSCVQSSAT